MRSTKRLMPEGAYTLSKMGSAYACVALVSACITIEIFVPYFLQTLHGHAPLAAGYLSALMSAGWTVGAVPSAGRSGAVVYKLLRIAPLISAVSLLALGGLMPLQYAGPWVAASVLALPLLGVGLGIGLCWPHLLTHIYKSAPQGQENMASSAVITPQLYTMAFGAALGGMITNAAGFIDPGGVEGTRSAALALLVSISAAPLLGAYLVTWVVRARKARAAQENNAA